MHQSVEDLFNVHDSRLLTKRVSQSSTQTTSKNVAIGIVLGVVTLVTCVIIAILLWRLARKDRQSGRRMRVVDLLEPARFSISAREDKEKGLPDGWWQEKPLPPRPISIMTSTRTPSSGECVNGQPGPTSLHSQDVHSTGEVLITCPPPPAVQFQHRVAMSTGSVTSSAEPSSTPTYSQSNTQTAPSLQPVHQNGSRSVTAGTTASAGPDTPRGQLTVVNVTESDTPPFQRPRAFYGDEYTRGRDAPFPSRKARSATIPAPPARRIGGVQPAEKQRLLNGPPAPGSTQGPSFSVHVPLTSALVPGSDLAPPSPRIPFTITATHPLSNVVVKEMRTVNRPDGTQGKGRMVTMSVFVEDSDASSNSDLDALENRTETRRESYGLLGENYVHREGELPPYSPRNESMR